MLFRDPLEVVVGWMSIILKGLRLVGVAMVTIALLIKCGEIGNGNHSPAILALFGVLMIVIASFPFVNIIEDNWK